MGYKGVDRAKLTIVTSQCVDEGFNSRPFTLSQLIAYYAIYVIAVKSITRLADSQATDTHFKSIEEGCPVF